MTPRTDPTEPRTDHKTRYLYQCPGCWSYGLWAIPIGGGRSKTDEGWIECECGELMTRIDLRRQEPSPLAEAAQGAAPRPVDGDRMRWLFENYGFGWGRDGDPPDDDSLADFIEDLREDFRAEAAQEPAPHFDNTTEACRHCPTPEVHPTRIGGILTYEGRCDPGTCEKHDHSELAAPRAEGLDVERLQEAIRLTTLDHYSPAAPASYAGRVAKHYARLSRPSDEQQP